MQFTPSLDQSFNESNKSMNTASVSVPADISSCIDRLELIYAKIYVGLRMAVRVGFANHSDVLEAGTYVQVRSLSMVFCFSYHGFMTALAIGSH